MDQFCLTANPDGTYDIVLAFAKDDPEFAMGPSRYNALLNDEQRAFCHSIYQFKQGDIHGIEFFKT